MMKKVRNILLAILIFIGLDYGIEHVLFLGIQEKFGLNQHSQMLMIGHSHLMLATDKTKMEDALKIQISKYTREGVNVIDRYYMVKQFLDSEYADSLKFCLYGVDLFSFTGAGLADNSYVLFYPFMDDSSIDKYIKHSASPIDYWSHKLIRIHRYNDNTLMNAALAGLRHDWGNRKYGVIDVNLYKQKLLNGDERHIEMDLNMINVFKATIKLLTERGVRVILVNTPTIDLLNNWDSNEFIAISKWYQDFAGSESNVEYWDFNSRYSSKYELFYDQIHLNPNGQKVITEELINKLKISYGQI
ncbi:MAG: SGNH/GDSL hydrolase family protein [Bacteroidaceae bacterium]|nr:SGNH/GDSL hydrolase family protein [Bacteroidaceae bacterium]